MSQTDSTGTSHPPTYRRSLRVVLGRLVMWSLPVVALTIGVFAYLASGRHVGTDNAYVKGDRVQIAAEISGVILEVAVQENQRVEKGQLLFRLDDQPFRLALAKAEAEMESARAEIQALRATYRQKHEEVKSAISQETFAQADYERQTDLANRRIASGARQEESRRDLDIARQRIAALREDQSRIVAQLGGDPKIKADDHPKVRQIKATRDEMALNVARTRVTAPIGGIATRKPVVGGYALAGATIMAVVADSGLWVEANYKETDLTRVRPGQAVTIRVDTYPDRVWYGTVGSISQATGAEFAVLPPQNASGNWVKVVQRIPVRVDLRVNGSDPPLRMGMSATVEIDTGHVRSLGELVGNLERFVGLGGANADTGRTRPR